MNPFIFSLNTFYFMNFNLNRGDTFITGHFHFILDQNQGYTLNYA